MLHQLAEAHAPGVGADTHVEAGGQEQAGDVVGDAADPAGVDLHHVDGLRLEKLLEHYPVGDVLTCGEKMRSVTGLSSPGNSVATTITFFEVSILRWISPPQMPH